MNQVKKSYELPISRSYVRHWGMAEAIRELIQNAIDSDSPFEYEFSGDTLHIRSRFSSLAVSTLLLGQTSKSDDTSMIGSFGEGYKIALLVLTREGYPVVIHNRDRRWTPCFRLSEQFQTEVLCIDDELSETEYQGVEFEIGGLDDKAKNDIRDSCLHMQSLLGEVVGTEYGQILYNRPGKLFVGSLFVCNTKMRYGYNVKPEYLRLERDRQTVSTFDLLFLTKNMWFKTERWDEIAKMIEDGISDVEYAEYGAPDPLKVACHRLFLAKNPGSLIAENHTQMNSFKARGLTNVVIDPVLYKYVSPLQSYSKPVQVVADTPEVFLRKFLASNRRAMRGSAIEAFKKKVLTKARTWRCE